jgi:hypothetical protein
MWVCPECNSEAIVIRATIEALIEVEDWDDEGEPLGFCAMVDWSCTEGFYPKDPPLTCSECGHDFTKPKRMSEAEYDEYWRDDVDND